MIVPDRLTGHTDRVMGVAISPEGNLAASASFDKTVKLWDLTVPIPGACLLQCDVVTSPWGAISVALSADLSQLTVIGAKNTAIVWDVNAAQKVSEFRFPPGNHRSLSPDGQRLINVDTQNKWIAVSEVGDPEVKRFPISEIRGPLEVLFSLNSQTMAIKDSNGQLQIWDLAKGREIYSAALPGSEGPVSSGQFHLEDYTVALSDRGEQLFLSREETQIFDLGTGQKRYENLPFRALSNAVLSPDASIVAVGTNGSVIELRDCATGAELHMLRTPGSIERVAFTPNGRTVVTLLHDGNLILWHVATGQEIGRFKMPEGMCCALRFSDDGARLGVVTKPVGTETVSLYVWPAAKRKD
ncbi:MAG TPA: PQQ-binding-like beta-propeller repeat protein [Pirellulales bacterium]